jgi:hypothetical protein
MLWSSGIEYASLQELPDHFPGVFSVPIWAHWCVRSAEAVCSLPVSSSSFVFYDHKWEQSETYLSVEISHFARRITMYIWSQLTRCQRNFCMKIYILARCSLEYMNFKVYCSFSIVWENNWISINRRCEMLLCLFWWSVVDSSVLCFQFVTGRLR